MQQYAEDAVKQHMSALQKAFFREKRGSRNAPYTSNAQELGNVKVENLINHAIKQTERYRVLKAAGASDEEIRTSFNTPREMNVFSYDGVVDTVMTPRDSLLWQKHFLRTGFMSMDPRNGHVKAYVGGPNFTFFQYDMASTGRRQIGSTIKPFLYTYAMEEGFTPCDMLSNTQPVFTDESGRPGRRATPAPHALARWSTSAGPSPTPTTGFPHALWRSFRLPPLCATCTISALPTISIP